jgi:putative addiction module CopG family antidote
MDHVTLPAELERFAAEAVAAGRFRDLSEVIAAGLSLLQRQEQARAEFIVSLEEAEAEGERVGFYTIDDVHAEMTGIIDRARRAKV